MPSNSDAQTGLQAPAKSTSTGPNIQVPSHSGAGLIIRGQIDGDEDLTINGRVEGPISLGNHRLTAGATAQMEGDIAAREIVIYGRVRGKLSGHDRIELKKESSVQGNLLTPRIIIEDGAHFTGSVEIERNTSKTPPDSATLLALAERNFKMKSIRAADSEQKL